MEKMVWNFPVLDGQRPSILTVFSIILSVHVYTSIFTPKLASVCVCVWACVCIDVYKTLFTFVCIHQEYRTRQWRKFQRQDGEVHWHLQWLQRSPHHNCWIQCGVVKLQLWCSVVGSLLFCSVGSVEQLLLQLWRHVSRAVSCSVISIVYCSVLCSVLQYGIACSSVAQRSLASCSVK